MFVTYELFNLASTGIEWWIEWWIALTQCCFSVYFCIHGFSCHLSLNSIMCSIIATCIFKNDCEYSFVSEPFAPHLVCSGVSRGVVLQQYSHIVNDRHLKYEWKLGYKQAHMVIHICKPEYILSDHQHCTYYECIYLGYNTQAKY